MNTFTYLLIKKFQIFLFAYAKQHIYLTLLFTLYHRRRKSGGGGGGGGGGRGPGPPII